MNSMISSRLRQRVRSVIPGLLVSGLLAVSSFASATNSPTLPSLKIDRARVTIAGVSSGAYMATQAQIAYPEIFRGAALVAGGPYGCAKGDIATAVSVCMKGVPPPDAAALADIARARAAKGEIGPLTALASAKVYILHGRQDPVVTEAVAQAGADFYHALKGATPALASMQITWDGARDFSHIFPTVDAGEACDKVGPPYLGKCGFDAAGAIFNALYGPARHPPAPAVGELRHFDQNQFRPDGADAFLADDGLVFLPPSCLKGKRCGVLVALHGCQQNVDSVGEAFVRDAGFNRWADVYDVVVLYPQTRTAHNSPLNPKACWDWYGYSGANYDKRDGVQLRWLVAALVGLGQSELLPAPARPTRLRALRHNSG